ncbi:hypothetical protein ACFW6V_36045 [Streptomyces sp. NPDC058734]|uniref:hypothetical protein n=1 Tax=Streptomyces sp. NPDC058734 TaxID=3346615 RepID=UPI0036955A28
MPTTSTADALDEHHLIEQYGHPLAELLSERYRVQDVLRERNKRTRTHPAAPPARQPRPDPQAAHHRRVLKAAIADWTYRPGP